MSISPRPVKHIPQRTCLACRRVRAKQEMIRVVRISDERVEVDIGGKKAGRGAYLCPIQECWEIGLKGGRLERSLKTSLTQGNREQLASLARDLLRNSGED